MSNLLFETLCLQAGPVKVNGYIIWDKASGEAMMIDPGGEAERICSFIEQHGLCLKYIVATHGHFDHIGALKELAAQYREAKVCMNEADIEFICDSEKNAASFAKAKAVDEFCVDCCLEDGQKLYLGNNELTVLYTPGHTPGQLSIYMPGHLFCGDTILRGTTGRMDLYGADYSLGASSIRNRIFPLQDETIIHCGHNSQSSVKYEKQFSTVNNDT